MKGLPWRAGPWWGRFVGRSPRILQSVGLLALVVVLAYLIVRMLFTFEGANPVSFVLLLTAELISLMATCLHFYEAWEVPERESPEPLLGTADIVITTYNEPLAVLDPTIVGSTRVRGAGHVWVLDDGKRDEVREYCARMGVRYVSRPDNSHAKAGNINHTLPQIKSEFILLLDADHVPARDILEKLMGYFRDPEVALVQSPHNFRNLDSMQHRDHQRHEQSLFFNVLMPARDRHGASFWCGSSAVLRMSALREIGGVATETVSEDLHTTTRLQRHGYRTRYHNEVLATGLAPHTMADFLLQRYRWAQGTMQVLLSPESPLFSRGWGARQRLHYLNNLIYYLLPFQRLLYVLVLVLVLLLAWLPVGSVSAPFVVLLAASVVMTNVASLGFARGMRDASDGIAYTWLTAETHMRAVVLSVLGRPAPFRVTPKSLNALGLGEKLRLLRVPIIVLGVVAVSWALRAWQEAAGSLPLGRTLPGSLDAIAFWVATGFVVLEAASVLPTIVRELRRTQRRALWRFNVRLKAHARETAVTITTIHEDGVSLVGPSGIAHVGDDVAFFIDPLPGTDLVGVSGVLCVKRVIGEGVHTSFSGPVRWPTEEDRHGVLSLCYADLAHHQR